MKDGAYTDYYTAFAIGELCAAVAAGLLKLIPGAGSVAGGAISAGTAGVITLALGKAYIEVCKAIKMGKLDQNDLTKKAGMDMLKQSFKEQMKKNKK